MNFRRIDEHNKGRIEKGLAPIETEEELIRKYWEINCDILQWNGRQIRNAFQTAMALADFEARESGENKPVITVAHFRKIAKVSLEFSTNLTALHKYGPDQLAQVKKNRLGYNPKTDKALKDVSSDESSDLDYREKRRKTKRSKGTKRDDGSGSSGETSRKGRKSKRRDRDSTGADD